MSFLNSTKVISDIFFIFSALKCIVSEVMQSLNKLILKKLSKPDSSVVDGLSSTEKYALKMLNKGYSLKSIALQTNLKKKRIRTIRKKYIN